MGAREACLLDSNILLRVGKLEDSFHVAILRALESLWERDTRLCYTSQTLGEFWNASTRPIDRNGFGLSPADAHRTASAIEREYEFLPDSIQTHQRWRALLVEHEIRGVKVHDARLAASMYVHGVAQILTINVRDFRRFHGLSAVHPEEVRGAN